MWKKKFEELFFGSNSTNKDLELARQIKFENMPSLLYKYRNFDEKDRNLNRLKNEKINLSKYDTFNDPHECAIHYNAEEYVFEMFNDVIDDFLESIKENGVNFSEKDIELIKTDKNPFKKIIYIYTNRYATTPEIKNNPKKASNILFSALKSKMNETLNNKTMLNHLKNTIFIGSFSSTYKSSKMWAHYADNQKGFCVGYNFKNLNLLHKYNLNMYPVFYENELFVANSFLKNNNSLIHKAAITKYAEWEYEKEWRLIWPDVSYLPLPNNKNVQFIEFDMEPEIIYMGEQISQINKNKLIGIAKSKNIRIVKLSARADSYDYDEEEITY